MSKQSHYEALAEYEKLKPLFKAAKQALKADGYEEICTVMPDGRSDTYGTLFALNGKQGWLNKDTIASILNKGKA